jgi:hypothetical protein
LDDAKRLELIVKAFAECEGVTAERVARQFYYETNNVPDVDQLARALVRAPRPVDPGK